MATFELDAQELDELQQKMEEYGEGAARQINDVLHGEGAKEINDQIMRILPASGRHWNTEQSEHYGCDKAVRADADIIRNVRSDISGRSDLHERDQRQSGKPIRRNMGRDPG